MKLIPVKFSLGLVKLLTEEHPKEVHCWKKKWEPRNTVPGTFLECFGKYIRIWKVDKNSKSSPEN